MNGRHEDAIKWALISYAGQLRAKGFNHAADKISDVDVAADVYCALKRAESKGKIKLTVKNGQPLPV